MNCCSDGPLNIVRTRLSLSWGNEAVMANDQWRPFRGTGLLLSDELRDIFAHDISLLETSIGASRAM